MSQSVPCFGFPISILFTDVEPHVLADEDASELPPGEAAAQGSWQAYLRRVLPALERGSASAMAEGLLAAGTQQNAALAHCATMRRRALAAGDARRVRFWDEVSAAIRGA